MDNYKEIQSVNVLNSSGSVSNEYYDYASNNAREFENMKRELNDIQRKKQCIRYDNLQEDNLKIITIIIPCHNEESGLPNVMADIPHETLAYLGYKADVLVIDNNSIDNTNPVAKSLGARVIFEPRQGKGRAIKTGFLNIHPKAEYVVMLDGDATYKAYEIPRLIEPLSAGFADVIIGSRLEGRMNGTSMEFSHRVANWFFTFITRRFYQANVTDTCSGFFAWTRRSIEVLNGHITSRGFAIEAEMITKMARLGLKIFSVPITYDKRSGNSKLVPVADGIRITRMLLRNIHWSPKKVNNQKQIRQISAPRVLPSIPAPDYDKHYNQLRKFSDEQINSPDNRDVYYTSVSDNDNGHIGLNENEKEFAPLKQLGLEKEETKAQIINAMMDLQKKQQEVYAQIKEVEDKLKQKQIQIPLQTQDKDNDFIQNIHQINDLDRIKDLQEISQQVDAPEITSLSELKDQMNAQLDSQMPDRMRSPVGYEKQPEYIEPKKQKEVIISQDKKREFEMMKEEFERQRRQKAEQLRVIKEITNSANPKLWEYPIEPEKPQENKDSTNPYYTSSISDNDENLKKNKVIKKVAVKNTTKNSNKKQDNKKEKTSTKPKSKTNIGSKKK